MGFLIKTRNVFCYNERGDRFHFRLVIWSRIDERPNVLLIAIDDLNDWVGCMRASSSSDSKY